MQRETGATLGEILVRQGKLTRLGLAQALSALWESRELPPLRPAGDDDPVDDTDIHDLASRDRSIARESQDAGGSAGAGAAAEAATQSPGNLWPDSAHRPKKRPPCRRG